MASHSCSCATTAPAGSCRVVGDEHCDLRRRDSRRWRDRLAAVLRAVRRVTAVAGVIAFFAVLRIALAVIGIVLTARVALWGGYAGDIALSIIVLLLLFAGARNSRPSSRGIADVVGKVLNPRRRL